MAYLWLDRDFIAPFGSNRTDATAAVNTAEASLATEVYIPYGLHETTLGPYDATACRYMGPGRLKMGGWGQARMRAFIDEPQPIPSPSRLQMFHDGFKKAFQESFFGVTANANPSSPDTDYTNFIEWSPYIYVNDFTAGYNLSNTTHSDGRSGAFGQYMASYHGGGGDFTNWFGFGSISSTKAGANHYLAQAAITLLGGALGFDPGGRGYIVGSEILFQGNYDGAAMGHVIDFERNVDTAAQGETWIGFRAQSTGTKNSDAAFVVSEKWRRGLDLTPWTPSSDYAGVVLPALTRIYFNSTSAADGAGVKQCATTLNGDYLHYNSTTSAIEAFVGGNIALSMSGSQVGVSTGGATRVYITHTTFTSNVLMRTAGGAIGYPEYSWRDETDAGLVRTAAGVFAFGVGGAAITEWTSTGLNLTTGKVLKVAGNQVIGPRDTGWTPMTGTANKATSYNTATITLAQLASRVMAIQTAITNHGAFGA